jgi:hypothetical protein
MLVDPQVGDYKGHPLYSGRDLEAFTDVDALAAAADRGRLMMADPAAAYLGCRPSDFGHLVRAHWIEPTKWVHGECGFTREFGYQASATSGTSWGSSGWVRRTSFGTTVVSHGRPLALLSRAGPNLTEHLGLGEGGGIGP